MAYPTGTSSWQHPSITMMNSCFTFHKSNSLKRFQSRFRRRSALEEIPEGRRLSFDQFLDSNFAPAHQLHDAGQGQAPSTIANASTGPDLNHRRLYRFSSTDTVSVLDSALDPRSPIPSQQCSPIPAMPDLSNSTSEETITIHFRSGNQRDSEDTATISSAPIDHAWITYGPSHPAIVDNPPPFTRYSDPPIECPHIVSPGFDSISPQQRVTHQESRLHLLHQRSQLHASRERLADRLEAMTEELDLTAERLHLVQEELLIREQQSADLRKQLWSLNKSHDGAIRAYDAALTELRELKTKHGGCGRVERFWRRMPLLKGYRTELKAKADGLEAALEISRRYIRSMDERFQVQQLEMTRMVEVIEAGRRDAQANDRAQLEEAAELAALMTHLRFTEDSLGLEREVTEGIRQHNRDLQLEIACLKHRVSTRTV